GWGSRAQCCPHLSLDDDAVQLGPRDCRRSVPARGRSTEAGHRGRTRRADDLEGRSLLLGNSSRLRRQHVPKRAVEPGHQRGAPHAEEHARPERTTEVTRTMAWTPLHGDAGLVTMNDVSI